MINLIFAPLPEELHDIKGMSTMDGPGIWTILINSTQAGIVQRHALGHELAHVLLGHFEKPEREIDELEREADAHAWEFYRSFRDGKFNKIIKNFERIDKNARFGRCGA